MNDHDLKFHVNSISDTLKSTSKQFNHAMTAANDALKIRALCEITGELSASLAIIRDEMETELKNRKAKKFWQFWK